MKSVGWIHVTEGDEPHRQRWQSRTAALYTTENKARTAIPAYAKDQIKVVEVFIKESEE